MRQFMIILFSFFITTAVLASDISIKAKVSSAQVPVGKSFQYTITLNGVQGLEPPLLPPVDGFDTRYSGPATRVAVLNGAYDVEQSFNYIFTPLKEGKFTIPSVTIIVKGQSFVTNVVEVDVIPAGKEATGASVEGETTKDIQSRLKFLMAVASDKIYIGEAVPVTIRLYAKQLTLQELSFPELKQDGFRIEPFSEPKQFQETLEGSVWQVIEFSTLLYPTRSGEVKVTSAEIRGSLLFKAEPSQDTSGGLFDDGFFGNFFTSYQKRPLTMTSNAVTLHVLSLPDEGKPADFSGAVGQFDFSAEATPLKLKSGDPVTLRMVLTGTGNMKAIKFPEFKAEGFKIYDPLIKDDLGRKNLEQVIILIDKKVSQVPALQFTYFDVKTNSYRTIKRGPFPLEVSASAQDDEFKAVSSVHPSAGTVPEILGQDIVFIKDNPGRWQKRSDLGWMRALFYGCLMIYLQVWGAFFVIYLRRRRMHNNPQFARKSEAIRNIRRTFVVSGECITTGKTKEFYEVLETGLRQYFSLRLDVSAGNMDAAALEQVLRKIKIDEKQIACFRDIFETAEQARFARMNGEAARMKDHLIAAQDIFQAVERRVK
ncbi:MAG: BatD family protein [Candidatus Omnitrophota bacterium]